MPEESAMSTSGEAGSESQKPGSESEEDREGSLFETLYHGTDEQIRTEFQKQALRIMADHHEALEDYLVVGLLDPERSIVPWTADKIYNAL